MEFSSIINFSLELLAVLLLALGIKGLSKVRSAREANILAAFAMLISVVGLLLSNYLGESGIPDQSWKWIIIGSALVLPWLTIKLLDFAPGKGVITSWFWADTRQQMPGLSLALIALLLAVSF